MVGPKLAYDAIHQCLLMFGHGGYDRGPMEQRLRDVLGFQIGDGTAQIMKTIVARTRAGRRPCRPERSRRPPGMTPAPERRGARPACPTEKTQETRMEFDAVLLPPRRAAMRAQGLWHDRTINDALDDCWRAAPTSWR
jgi:hypothetical protein